MMSGMDYKIRIVGKEVRVMFPDHTVRGWTKFVFRTDGSFADDVLGFGPFPTPRGKRIRRV
jgi:hypothetical protein